ncbi:MAG: hypothetical protein EBR09_07645 [Proteobacteria bacterium]|nr:hypothetical protein [Pseudomonadota bacterium]
MVLVVYARIKEHVVLDASASRVLSPARSGLFQHPAPPLPGHEALLYCLEAKGQSGPRVPAREALGIPECVCRAQPRGNAFALFYVAKAGAALGHECPERGAQLFFREALGESLSEKAIAINVVWTRVAWKQLIGVANIN